MKAGYVIVLSRYTEGIASWRRGTCSVISYRLRYVDDHLLSLIGIWSKLLFWLTDHRTGQARGMMSLASFSSFWFLFLKLPRKYKLCYCVSSGKTVKQNRRAILCEGYRYLDIASRYPYIPLVHRQATVCPSGESAI